jgi:hypothetical protein
MLLTALISREASALATYSVETVSGSPDIVIRLTGEIEPGDYQRFIRFGLHPLMSGRRLLALSLNSEGGNVSEALNFVRAVKGLGLKTVVDTGSVCASACFLIFAAGIEKLVDPTAIIAVHSVFDSIWGETATAKSVTVDGARVAASLGVPPTIIGRMVITPPSGSAILTRRELKLMGVHFLPPRSSR